MITKLLSLLPATLRYPINAIRPQNNFQKHLEWQSEFLFMPEKRPLLPALPMTQTCFVSTAAKSHLRTR
jgi:hypothetical protein